MKTIALFFFLFSCSRLPAPVAVTTSSETESSTFKIIHPRVCLNEAEQGNFVFILESLVKDGYRITPYKTRFTVGILKECEILFVTLSEKTLSGRSVLTTKKTGLVHAWVLKGGSLVVTAEAPANFLGKFGIRESGIKIKDSPVQQMNLSSPIILGRSEAERIKVVPPFSGRTLQGPKNADLFLRVVGLDHEATGLALKLGTGRVTAFADKSVFTSQHEIQLALNVFHWLSHVL